VLEVEESLLELIEKEGPFDGVFGYSAGAALAGQIICSDAEKFPFKSPEERPFRFACFVNAISPLKVFRLEDEEVQDGVIDVDSVTNPLVKEALDEFLRPSATRARKSFHKAADMPDSKTIRQEAQALETRLLADGTPFFTDGVLGMTRYDVNFHGTLINMPTMHVRCPEGGDAHNNGAHTQALCEPDLAKEINHPFGHDFPRGHQLLKKISTLFRETADAA
jgi:Serine hydrolase (FSH1)